MPDKFETAIIIICVFGLGLLIVSDVNYIGESISPNLLVTYTNTKTICINNVINDNGHPRIITSDAEQYYVHPSKQDDIDVILFAAHQGDTCQITYINQWPKPEKYRYITEASCNTKPITCGGA
jgi:hypothetical protein